MREKEELRGQSLVKIYVSATYKVPLGMRGSSVADLHCNHPQSKVYRPLYVENRSIPSIPFN